MHLEDYLSRVKYVPQQYTNMFLAPLLVVVIAISSVIVVVAVLKVLSLVFKLVLKAQ